MREESDNKEIESFITSLNNLVKQVGKTERQLMIDRVHYVNGKLVEEPFYRTRPVGDAVKLIERDLYDCLKDSSDDTKQNDVDKSSIEQVIKAYYTWIIHTTPGPESKIPKDSVANANQKAVLNLFAKITTYGYAHDSGPQLCAHNLAYHLYMLCSTLYYELGEPQRSPSP